MIPINVSMFAHLRKHCSENRICFQGGKTVSQQVQKQWRTLHEILGGRVPNALSSIFGDGILEDSEGRIVKYVEDMIFW